MCFFSSHLTQFPIIIQINTTLCLIKDWVESAAQPLVLVLHVLALLIPVQIKSFQVVMFCFDCVCVHSQVAALKTMAIQGGPTYSLSQQPWAQPGKICLRKRHWHHTVIHQILYSEC